MAIIYSYPLNDNIGSSDELVGTTEKSINGQLKTVTRNFLLGDLSTFFIEKGGIQKTIILTTAGSNGPATLNTLTGELNIPQYSGATDLGYIASALNGIVTSSTGLDATIPLANSTIAGLLSPANFIVLSNTSGINTGDQNLQQVTNLGANTTNSITANSFIRIDGTGDNVLLDNGNTVALSSIGGNQNLQEVTDLGANTTNSITANSITTTIDSTINGVRVGRGNISDPVSENTAVGYQALKSVVHTTGTTGYYNTAFGDSALTELISGEYNSAFGAWALIECTTGKYNTAVGTSALRKNNGEYNTGVGVYALGFNKGSYNTAIGFMAGGVNTTPPTGNWNILVGMQAGRDITSGSNNLLIENITNASITSGSYNIVLNPKQKSGVTTGSYNTIIGCWDGAFPSAMLNNVIIGDGQGNIRFRTTETGLTTVPGQTNALITADTTGKAVVTKEYLTNSQTVFVPYTGATTDVNLGLNDITAAKLIKDGGFDYQFLKADGSVDNNTYLTSADLPSTLDLYATTSPDPVIPGYTALVRNIADTRYNTTAVNVPTPLVDGTLVAPTLCGVVISDPSVLLGNPGVFNFTVIGNIRRVSGSTSSGADFFYKIYKRDLAGTEVFITDSAKVPVPANGGFYIEYISTALWNNGTFLSTDRIVLKFYGIQTGGGTGAYYEFLFGGADPVRGTAAISSAIIPNIYLRDLADVEKVPAENNEILYWNDPASLWEHELAENLVPLATATQKGLVSTTGQTFGGVKTFANNITASANIIGTNTPDISNASYSIIIRNASTGVFEKLGATTIQPLIYNILITSTVGITTQTLGTNGGLEYSQDGRNVMIANGTTPIQVTASNASSSFIASYTKLGTANITFATSGTLVAPYGAILNGNPGSTALLTKNGTTVYLLVNNLL